MLEIVKLTLGPVQTNAYLIADQDSGDAAVIDPAWDGTRILAVAKEKSWNVRHLWYTHAHFDHIGGAADVADNSKLIPLVALHPADHNLWKAGGGGSYFGFSIDPGPEPDIDLNDDQILRLGKVEIKVLHTPGHTPGHCAFYAASDSVLFSGDLIFQNSVGRTDLSGGDFDTLVKSIQEKVFPLPDDTRILSGHGPETTVGWEKINNPFVNQNSTGRFI
jgi:glyoxylase-like metal-dependent hydrolase (beta-lactamase superfamily II)